MTADTAPAWDGVSSIWVLAYELRFPGEEGRWPQAARRSFNTEAEARAYVRSVKGAYQICRVELPSEVTAREAAAWAAGAAAMRATLTGEDAVEAFLSGFYGCKSGFTESIRDGLLAVRSLPIPPMPTQGGSDE